jgi:hypothetical protein
LVNRDGTKIECGSDNALTVDELHSVIEDGEEDLLYFAYNEVVYCNDSTQALFTGVQFNRDAFESPVNIIKYFTKNDGADLYYAVATGHATANIDPSKDRNDNYIYKYKIAVNGVETDEIYETYADAKLVADSYKKDLGEEFGLSVQASAIQAVNDAKGEEWSSPENWYPQLPDDF